MENNQKTKIVIFKDAKNKLANKERKINTQVKNLRKKFDAITKDKDNIKIIDMFFPEKDGLLLLKEKFEKEYSQFTKAKSWVYNLNDSDAQIEKAVLKDSAKQRIHVMEKSMKKMKEIYESLETRSVGKLKRYYVMEKKLTDKYAK